jgi:capsular exopolysaccharide synthesis family protein
MSTQASQIGGSIDFREYLATLRLRKWSILVIAAVCLGLALAYTAQQTPMYSSSAKILATNPIAQYQGLNSTANPNMETEQSLVTSTAVAKCAVLYIASPTAPVPSLSGSVTDYVKNDLCADDKLDAVAIPAGLPKRVAASVPTNTNILQITATDPKATVAQVTANAFAKAYVDRRLLGAVEFVQGQLVPLNNLKTTLTKQIADLNHKLYVAILAGQNGAAFATQISNVGSQLSQVQQSLSDLSPTKIAQPTLEVEAVQPQAPSSPNKKANAAIGLVLGLLIGVGLAFLREALSDELRGRSDFEDYAGVPVLAVIPKVASWRKKSEARLITLQQPKSVVAEAYRTLRTSILFSAMQRGLQTFMVVSANAGEGKSTTAANLAVVLADAGKRVVLISADLRKPRLHQFFNLQAQPGLSNALAGEVKPWEALQNPTVENLRVMASGPVPARPTELLQSDRMGELLADLRDISDFVIIDTSPILPVADALVIAALVDGVLMVADASITTRSAITHTRELLDQVDAPLVGAVFNDYDPTKDRGGAGYYGYGARRYGYYGEPEKGIAPAFAPVENGQSLRVATANPAAPLPRPETSSGEPAR